MAAPTCSDEEFIELWRTHQSAIKIARVLELPERAVFSRRRKIEKRYNIALGSDHPNSQQYARFKHIEHAARYHLEIENGVALVFSDAHFWPGLRTTAFRALLWAIKTLKPAAIVNNGDAFDGASISRHPRIAWDQKPTVIEELKACTQRLEEIQKAAGKALLIWSLGNHDTRFETRLSQNAPEFEGVQGFRLADHFPAWKACWSCWINDDVVIKHRFKGGIHATHNNTLWSGKSIVTGHLHSLKVTPLDDYDGTRWGVDTGTLADPDGPQFADYLEDNPVNWRSGFVVLTFREGQLLWPEIVRVVDEDTVDFRGKLHTVPE